MKQKQKLIIVAALAAATFGVVGASAASLGALSSGGVGSSDGAVGSCDTNGVGLTYQSTFNATAGRFDVNGVTVSGLDALCNSKLISVVLKNSSTGAATSSVTYSAAVSGGGAVLTGPPIAAESLQGVSVIVTG